MKILINASNIHLGGGKTLLNDFIFSALNQKDTQFTIFVDSRYINSIDAKNIVFIKINRFKRFLIDYKIKNVQSKFDKIIFFGNLPPFFKFKNKTILLLSSRFYLEKFNLKEFKFYQRLQIVLEKLIFYFFIKNIDEIIVQSDSMIQLAKHNKKIKSKLSLIAFKNFKNNQSVNKNINIDPNKNIFIYVASEHKYKNHLNLVRAWKYLSKINIEPILHITMSNEHPNFKKINEYSKNNNLNIINHSNIDSEELLSLYSNSNILVYPSLFEAYGLPLIEARHYGLRIVASELDYVRDVIDPDETFNPNSHISIAKAILRILNIDYQKTDIISANKFINIIKAK